MNDSVEKQLQTRDETLVALKDHLTHSQSLAKQRCESRAPKFFGLFQSVGPCRRGGVSAGFTKISMDTSGVPCFPVEEGTYRC